MLVPAKFWFYEKKAWSEELYAATIVAASTLLKIAICPFIGLGVNESYAIASGRVPSLSYFDHPPFHFWLAHLCELAFGYTNFARIPFILLGAGSSWLMFLLTRQLFGSRAGVFSTAIMNLTVFFGLMSGNWILPDGPLNFFLLATALVLAPVAKGEVLDAPSWILAGLLIGIAALSKYHAILFVAGFFFFLISTRERRKHLAEIGPWLACLFAFLVFLPVVFWNAANGWVSVMFQGGRAEPHHIAFGKFASLALEQALLLLPGALAPLVRGTWSAMHAHSSPEKFLLWLGLPTALLLTLLPLITAQGMMHWAMPGWLLLLPLAGKHLANDTARPWRFLVLATVVFLAVVAIGVSEFQTGWPGSDFPRFFKRGDPTAEYTSWNELARIISTSKAGGFVITNNWRDAVKIDQGLDGKYRILVSSNDPRNFAIDANPTAFSGRSGWIVVRSSTPKLQTDRLRSCFGLTEPALTADIKQQSSPPTSLLVISGGNFKPPSCEMPTFNSRIRPLAR